MEVENQKKGEMEPEEQEDEDQGMTEEAKKKSRLVVVSPQTQRKVIMADVCNHLSIYLTASRLIERSDSPFPFPFSLFSQILLIIISIWFTTLGNERGGWRNSKNM